MRHTVYVYEVAPKHLIVISHATGRVGLSEYHTILHASAHLQKETLALGIILDLTDATTCLERSDIVFVKPRHKVSRRRIIAPWVIVDPSNYDVAATYSRYAQSLGWPIMAKLTVAEAIACILHIRQIDSSPWVSQLNKLTSAAAALPPRHLRVLAEGVATAVARFRSLSGEHSRRNSFDDTSLSG